jgi:hypothetical protein
LETILRYDADTLKSIGEAMTTPNPKLEALRKKEAAIKAQIAQAEAKQRNLNRKEDTRLKVLVGAAFVTDVGVHPETRAGVLAVLDRAIIAERDREFLKAKGWL